MADAITSISYEQEGFPCDLGTPADWRRAIERQKIRRDTRVIVLRGAKSTAHPAYDVPELRAIFDEFAMRSPAALEALVLRLIEQHGGGGDTERTQALERRVDGLERELEKLKRAVEGRDPPPPPARKQPAVEKKAQSAPAKAEEPKDPFAGYRALLGLVPLKPGQFREFFASFTEARAVTETSDGALKLGAPADRSADAVLIAVKQGDSYSVVPGFAYVSMFGRAFHRRGETPPMVARLFELDPAGEGDGMHLIAAAKLRSQGAGQLEIVTRGRLAGFTD